MCIRDRAEASDQVYCATSWDYSSAFDRVAPGICCELWRRSGVPTKVTKGIFSLWTDVRRVLELGGETAP
eukprot:1540667-Alexandrium_andersonii.AAC.1